MGGKRFITGIILIPVVYLLIRYLPPLYFSLVVALIASAGLYEFYRFYFERPGRFTMAGIVFGNFLLLSFYGVNKPYLRDAFLWFTMGGIFIFFLIFKETIRHVIMEVSIVICGILYIAWSLGHLILLRDLFQGRELLYFLLIVTYSVDTGAYYTGRTLGRHKLSPLISPGKTVEGAIGGIFWAIGGAFLARWLFVEGLSLQETVITGIILGIISQIGDLTESLLKRSAGVKDSGHIVPGHGGILDRIDSLIFTAPAFYYYIHYLLPEFTRFPV